MMLREFLGQSSIQPLGRNNNDLDDEDLDDAVKGDDIGAAPQVLQDLYLPLDLLLLHRFQCLHHTLLVVVDVNRLKHLKIIIINYT